MDKIVPQEQICRVKGRKMADIIRNLDSYRDYSEDGYFILLDQAKAFDRVNHDYLFKTLDNLGMKGYFLEITKTLYSNITSQVIINGGKTDNFLIDRGVRQGCQISNK